MLRGTCHVRTAYARYSDGYWHRTRCTLVLLRRGDIARRQVTVEHVNTSDARARRTWHVARGTSHVARGTSHVAHVARRTSHVARRTSHVARRTSHVARGTWHVEEPPLSFIDHLVGDARHALRTISRMPLLASVVVVSLGIGIGVNVVVFSWLQAVVLQPLPGVAHARQLVFVEPRVEAGTHPGVSWQEYEDLRDGLRTFDSLIAFRMVPFNVGEPSRNERIYGQLVSGNYFSGLGLTPSAGRFFRADEGLAVRERFRAGGVARAGAGPFRQPGGGDWPEPSRQRSRCDHRRRRPGTLSGHGARPRLLDVGAGHARALAARGFGRARLARGEGLCRARAARGRRYWCPGAGRPRERDAGSGPGRSREQRRHGRPGDVVLGGAARPAVDDDRGARCPAGHHAAGAPRGVRQHREPDAGAGEHAPA